MILYESERADPSGGIYHQRNEGLYFIPHLHDSFEFIYVYEGELHVSVDEIPHTVDSGHAILIFPNQIHSITKATSSKTYLCIFQNSLVGEFAQIAKKSFSESPVFSIDRTTIIDKLTTPSIPRYLLKSYLYEIISIFDASCPKYLPRQKRSSELIGKMIIFIEENYAKDISISDVASDIGYDYHYLSNLLSKHLKTTFRTILNEYRISHAKYLLTSSGSPISVISRECGYDSLCSFNRNFKMIVGCTPSEYRCRH